MTDTVSYRGPDDSGYYMQYISNDWQIGFGHRRLSIQDVSPLGHQPMFSDDRKIAIIFNGEIYNFGEIRNELISKGYDFKSGSDTEIIINAYKYWGIDCINEFNGMFAFALFDFNDDILYLVRDRMGVKPLYYYIDSDIIVFTSELKPLLQYPFFKKQINSNALRQYLFYGYIPAPMSIFENTFKLLPGHYIKYQFGKKCDTTYWSLNSVLLQRSTIIKDESSYLENLEYLLKDSVKLRMISDVPLGVFLSGGIDSSLITALMCSVSKDKIKTFTIGFDDPNFDESHYAKKISEYLGTEHYEMILSVEQVKDMIDKIPYYCDEPFADSSLLPTMLLSKLTRQHVTVALSGDAGDELFCGYSIYNTILQYSKMKKTRHFLQRANNFIPLGSIMNLIKPFSSKLLFLTDSDDVVDYEYKAANFYLDPLLDEIFNNNNNDHIRRSVRLGKNIQEKEMIFDILHYLPDDILTKVDRASMASSLEARNPLLDFRVIEYSFNIPHYLKFNNFEKKYLLKKILSKYLPSDFFERPKKGFGVPISRWMKNDLQYLFNDYFSTTFIKKQDIFRQPGVDRLISLFSKTRSSKAFQKYVWNLLVFQIWYKTYMMDGIA